MIDFFWVWFGLVWFGLVWFSGALVGQGKYFIGGGGPECFRGFWMASFQDCIVSI